MSSKKLTRRTKCERERDITLAIKSNQIKSEDIFGELKINI